MTERTTSRCLLRGDAIDARMKELSLKRSQAAAALGVSERALQYYLARERRCPLDAAEALAKLLGVGLDEVADDVEPFERARAEEAAVELSAPERDFRRSAVLVTVVLAHWDKFRWYSRHVGLRWWPLLGFVRSFKHSRPRGRGFYAEVTISLRKEPRPNHTLTFILSFNLGPARIDYGYILAEPSGEVETKFVFGTPSSRPESAGKVVGNKITFWTWFGREPCEFMVRSRDIDFTLSTPLNVGDNLSAHPPHVVCFPAAAHHIEDA